MSDVSWACEVSGLPTNLTVGAIFTLKCAGAEVPGLNTQGLSLSLPKLERFKLRILENRKSTSSSVELGVTSYVPGDTKLNDVVLTDGLNRISLSGVNFTVMSVIPEGEEAKPYAAFPPAALLWPTGILVMAGGLVLAIILLIAFLIQARTRHKKFMNWLVTNRTSLSAFDQLSKDLRRAVKERDPLKQIRELELITRTYLSREFRKPLLDASARRVLKVISRGDKKTFEKLQPLTIRLFGEFERVPESLRESQTSATEALNTTLPEIHEMIREFAETLQSGKSNRRRVI